MNGWAGAGDLSWPFCLPGASGLPSGVVFPISNQFRGGSGALKSDAGWKCKFIAALLALLTAVGPGELGGQHMEQSLKLWL